MSAKKDQKKVNRFFVSEVAFTASADLQKSVTFTVTALVNESKKLQDNIATAVCNAVVTLWRGKGKAAGCACLLNALVNNPNIKGVRAYVERIGVKINKENKLSSLTLPNTVQTEADLWKHLEAIPFEAVTVKTEKPEAPKLSGDAATKWIVGQIKRLAHNSKNKCASTKFANELAFIAEHYDEVQKFIATYKKANKN